MSKLGEILKKIKEDKAEISHRIEVSLSKVKHSKSLRILFLLFSIILFSSSVIGGYLIVNIFSQLAHKKNNIMEQHYQSQVILRNESEPSKISSMENYTLSANKSMPARFENGSKLTPVVTSKLRPVSNQMIRPVERSNFAVKDKSDITTINVTSGQILRERKLYENLLVVAEEARKNGKISEAISYYKEYLKYREDPDILNNLAGLYILIGDHDNAERILHRALSLRYDEVYEVNLLITLWKKGARESVCQRLYERREFFKSYEVLKELYSLCNI